MSTDPKRHLKLMSRLEAVGVLHQDAAALAQLTIKWAEASGEEWTVKRFKALKLEFITSVLATDCAVRRAPWIARRPDGSIAGPLRRFWVDQYYMIRPQVVLNALQIYSSFIASSATESQVSKFVDSASADPVVLPLHLTMFIKKFDWDFAKRFMAFDISPYWKYYRSPIKRVPSLKGTAPEIQIDSDLAFASNSEAVRLMYRFQKGVMNLTLPMEVLNAFKLAKSSHNYVGCISFIQEAGYKLRAVANPTRVIQHALEPLKEVLAKVLSTFPEDCTFDQDRGVDWCQSQLQQGKRLSSIDLSDATNLFPFEVQDLVLSGLSKVISLENDKAAFSQFRSVLRQAAKAEWRMPDGTSLRFSKGQPLGLGPSFFLFALSHHIILKSLNGSGKYVILGDDIVISDDDLAERYRKLMSEIGCIISEDKSIASQQLAEFASRLIRPNDVLRQWKWREITRSNVIDVCRNMGPKIRKEVKKPLTDVVDALALIPIEIGGLGWNPRGKSLSSRFDTSVAQYLLYSLRENLVVLRRWSACATSDFLRAHMAIRGANPVVAELHPWFGEDLLVPSKFHLSLWDDGSWEREFTLQQIEELNRMGRTGPDLGETILWPRDGKPPSGYIVWGPQPCPWRAEPTSGLYQVVARILKGEKSAASR